MKTILSLYILCVMMQPYAMSRENVLSLVTNGSSQFVVVVNKNATAEEERAASVLRYYIKQVTGCNLPVSNDTFFQYTIRIYQDTLLPVEGFAINALNKYSIRLVGGKQNGVVNAAWMFLKMYLGVDYLGINSVFVDHEDSIVIQIPLLIRQQPSFVTRTIYSPEGYDYDYIEAHALKIPFLDHFDFAHSFHNDMLPPAMYFKSHPEYYIKYNGRSDSSQPNLLHPEVFSIVLKNLRKKILLDTLNRYHYYSISLNDNPLVSEDSEIAKILAKNGQNYASILLKFVNRIADSIPDKKFTTLAYEQTKSFPSSVTRNKNVTIILTNADNDKSKSINTDDYDQIQKLYMKEQIPRWVSLDSGLILWDYIANFSHPFMPWPILFTIKPNLHFFNLAGVKHLFLQNAGRFTSENGELKAYLCANLMWDITYNDDSLIEVFCKKYYQRSWRVMYNYISDINREAFVGTDHFYTYDSPVKFKNTLFKYNNITAWLSMLKKAETEAESEIIRKRILKERLGLDYVLIEISTSTPGWNSDDNKSTLYKKLDEFMDNCVVAGISKLGAEGYLNGFKLNVHNRLQLK
jgi:hypothetical protein